MSDAKKPTGRRRASKNTFTTKSGSAIKLNRSLNERLKAHRDARARRRAAYLSTLPKNPFKRFLFRLHPKELARYWFSRDGAIMALKLLGVAIVVGFVLIVGIFAYFRKDLPNIKDLSGRELGGSITYYDRTGQTILWQDYDAIKRQPVATDSIAPSMRQATVAVEDKDFYKHGAFDVRGIARAGVNNFLNRGDGVQGGSTISQQLVKIDRRWTAQRTIGNKIKEVILAVEMEREYSKDDILTGYLNAAPYGPVAVGVQVGAQDYFGVNAKDLTIAQAAMLAAIPKAPSTYSPYGPNYQPNLLLARQRYIIDQMASQKMITKAQATEAKAVDILAQVKPEKPSLYTGMRAPYFVLAAKDELQTRYGNKTVQRGGWKVITTLNLPLQDLAEKKVADDQSIIKSQQGKLYPQVETAFAAIDNATGQMVALVGGRNFNDPNDPYSQINFAHKAPISPGSSFKPYDYSTFIDNNNAGAGSVFYDSTTPDFPNPGNLPGYRCKDKSRPSATEDNSDRCLWDYDFQFPGPLTIRYALGGSRNVPAVKAGLSTVPNDTSNGHLASINKTISTAEAMMSNPDGYACYDTQDILNATKEDETQCYGSSMIGDGAYVRLDDHVTGLSTLARMGQAIPHTYILKITDAAGKTVDEFKQPQGKQVIKAETAYILNDILSDPNASYLNAGRKFHRYKGWNFAIKTGTTNFAFDGLMASWSTQYTAVSWVGVAGNRNQANRMKGAMENMTEPITQGWMLGAHDILGIKPVNWVKPSGIQTLPAFVVKNHVGLGSVEPSPSNDLFPSWYKPPKGNGPAETIDLVSNKTATTCTPDLAKKTSGESSQSNFSVDIFSAGGAAGSSTSSSPGSTSADDVHNCNDAKPSLTLTAPANCHDSSDCTFTVAVTSGSHPLSGGSYTTAPAGTLSLIVNGQVAQTVPIPSDSQSLWNYTFNYSPASTGSANVQVQVVDSVLYSSSENTNVTFN